MTTNGITLSRKLPALLDAGLNAVNISLDTLGDIYLGSFSVNTTFTSSVDPFKFQMITRRNGHDRVLRAIEDAQGSGEVNVKVNCVVMRGTNMDEIVDFVEFTRDRDVEVRFIESVYQHWRALLTFLIRYMPFDGNRWNNDKFVSYQEMLELIQHRHPGQQALLGSNLTLWFRVSKACNRAKRDSQNVACGWLSRSMPLSTHETLSHIFQVESVSSLP